MVIGIAAGGRCYCAILLKNRMKWDDALDVWGVHGVGGLLGIILLGVFASTAVNPNGRRRPDPRQRQLLRQAGRRRRRCSLYAFGFTYVMLRVINAITPVKVTEEDERHLDQSLHGEMAYAD